MPEDEIFWVGQKAFIENKGEVLIITDPIEGLDFPGGKIQKGEADTTESLKREVREETGLEIDIGQPFSTWIRTFPSDHKHAGKKVYLIAFKCRYLSGEVTLSKEHNMYRWVNSSNFKEVNDGTEYFEILEKYFQE